MSGSKAAIAAIASVLLAGSAYAQTTPHDRLVERYGSLAGDHTPKLIESLREGKTVTLVVSPTQEIVFDPATSKMGYGNVDHALGLAEASLKDRGIENPGIAQVTAELDRILEMRAEGMGWGRIAQELGFKLGEVKSAQHRSPRADRVARIDKPERPDRPGRPERPARPERPERAHR